MKQFITTILSLITISVCSQTVISRGDTIKTDEVWSADTVKITSSIVVADGVKLTINPGVYVEFQNHYRLSVQGSLLAIGDPLNRITFTAKDTALSATSGGWSGILFEDIPETNDSSIIKFCDFEWGHAFGDTWYDEMGSALKISNVDKLAVINSRFSKCSGTYYRRCVIAIGYSNLLFFGNVIADNNCSAINLSYANPGLFSNNTIANNDGYGISFFLVSPLIQNCIVYSNAKASIDNYYNSNPIIKNCNIDGVDADTNGNFDFNPEFIGFGEHPYNLLKSSRCINSGTIMQLDSAFIYGVDLAGNPRIYEGYYDSIVDVGAYEYQGHPTSYMEVT